MAGILTNTAKNNHLTLQKVLTNPATIAAKNGNLTQNGSLQESKSRLNVNFTPEEEKEISKRIHGDQMQHQPYAGGEVDEEEGPWREEDEEIEEDEDEEEILESVEKEEEKHLHDSESDNDKHDEEEEDVEEVDELEEENHDEEEYELENTQEWQGEEELEGNFVLLNSLKYAIEILWVDDETGEKRPALLDGEHIIPPNKKVDISAFNGHVFHAYPAGNTSGDPIKTFQVDEESFGLELDMEL